MRLWKQELNCTELNQLVGKSMIPHLGIKIIELGDNFLKASMPIDERTCQPFGYLHGGASCTLAETVASIAANLCLTTDQVAVGQVLNANHLRPAQSGEAIATARPVRIGKSSQIWEIQIEDSEGKQINLSHLTVSIINRNNWAQ